jgi:hypothetical protein
LQCGRPPFFKKAMQDLPLVKQPSSSDQAILSDMSEEAMDVQTISCPTAEVQDEEKNALEHLADIVAAVFLETQPR